MDTQRSIRCAALVLMAVVVFVPAGVMAGIVAEVEPNDTPATAQYLAAVDFTLDFHANIGDTLGNTSTTIPHITIQAQGDNTFDYYSFDVVNAGTRGIFDVDETAATIDGPLDLEIFLFRDDMVHFAENDDAPITNGALGSTSARDPFLEYVFASPGRYILAVGRFNSIALSTGIGGSQIKPGDEYQLHVSLDSSIVPEPATWLLSLMATVCLAARSAVRRRRR